MAPVNPCRDISSISIAPSAAYETIITEVHPSLTTVLTIVEKSVAVSSYPICVQMLAESMLATKASASPDPYALVM